MKSPDPRRLIPIPNLLPMSRIINNFPLNWSVFLKMRPFEGHPRGRGEERRESRLEKGTRYIRV